TRGPVTSTFLGRSRYSSRRRRTVPPVARTGCEPPQPAAARTRRGSAAFRRMRRRMSLCLRAAWAPNPACWPRSPSSAGPPRGPGGRRVPREVLGPQGRQVADPMLDLRRIRSEPDTVRAALDRRGDPSIGEALDRVLALDARRRELLPELEQLRARKNKTSEAIGAAKRSGENASDAIAAMKELGAREKELS